MSRYSNSSLFSRRFDDAHGGQWSQGADRSNNDRRNQIFEDQFHQRKRSSYQESQQQNFPQGFRDTNSSVDRNQLYSHNDNNLFHSDDDYPRKMMRLDDYNESSRSNKNQPSQDYSEGGPYRRSVTTNQFPTQSSYPQGSNRNNQFLQPNNQFQNQYPRKAYSNQCPPPGSNQVYAPSINQRYIQESVNPQGVNSYNSFYSQQQVSNRGNQFRPTKSMGDHLDHLPDVELQGDRRMNETMSFQQRQYSEVTNADQSMKRYQTSFISNNDQMPPRNFSRSQRHHFPGPSRQNANFANDLEFEDNDQFVSQAEDGNFSRSTHFLEQNEFESTDQPSSQTEDYLNEFDDECPDDEYMMNPECNEARYKKPWASKAERKIESQMRCNKIVKNNSVQEAKYAKEYRLQQRIPSVPKRRWTVDTIRNRSGLVGEIVIITSPSQSPFDTLCLTAKTWNKKFLLSESEEKFAGNPMWTATARFDGVVLAKTQADNKTAARYAAAARALWKLYQWYFVVLKGRGRNAKAVANMEKTGDQAVKGMVICPNSADQLRQFKFPNKTTLPEVNGTIDEIKDKIKAYAEDTTNNLNLVFSYEFNIPTRKALKEYAETFDNLETSIIGARKVNQLVLNKTNSKNGWEMIADILNNRALYNKTRQFVMYAPGDYFHYIPFKYPNVTYID